LTRTHRKRHMENPNIHNIPYVRSRDQKRWKGHAKKLISKEETTESNNDRMRKWRAENREKNRQNDLRCRVYRLARQRFGDHDSPEKQNFVKEEISRRLGRRIMLESKSDSTDLIELPFYSGLQQKIKLPSIQQMSNAWSSNTSFLPELSPNLQRRTKLEKESPFNDCILPSMHTFLSFEEKSEGIKYADSNSILDDFVGVVLNYVDNSP
ncbi:hypothetical protein CU098_005580, partial [Rhizopus stolonifer]